MMSWVKVLSIALAISLIQGKVLQRNNLDANCPQGTFASFSNDKCWLLVQPSQNFIEAAQYCRSYGGDLTSIHNAFDNIFLADKAQRLFPQSDLFYIGGSNLQDSKQWSWLDGSSVDYMDWANYEPIDADINNCIVVNVGAGRWHSHDCTSPAPFVCEVSQVLPTTPPPSWNLTTTPIFYNVSTPQPNYNMTGTPSSFNASTPFPWFSTPSASNTTGTNWQWNTTGTINGWNATTPWSFNTATTPWPFNTTGGSSNTSSQTFQPNSAGPSVAPWTPIPPSQPSSFTQGRQSIPRSPPTSGNEQPSFKTLLGSLAVGKAFEYFPKFDHLKYQTGQHRTHPSHFKSYRKM